MSKIIKLTPQYIEECKNDFLESLAKTKVADGRISFSKTFTSLNRKAKVSFTEMAWMKMQALVREFEKEVAWHGVAFRGDDKEKDEYIITDILVYPQEVSGASVEMDVAKYEEWIRDNFEDERFFNIGMQGHSHVKMGVTPSSVDLNHQEAILEQLTDDMFYIFMIWNKMGDKNIKIYDLAKNVLFETSDIEVEVLAGDYGIDAFVKDAKGMVKERVTTYYYGNGYKSGYTYGNTTTPKASTSTPNNTGTTAKKEEKKNTQQGKSGKRRGNRKKSKSRGAYNNACDSSQITLFEDGYDDYPYNDPFYARGY